MKLRKWTDRFKYAANILFAALSTQMNLNKETPCVIKDLMKE